MVTRVVQWATGAVGTTALAELIENDDYQLVGVLVYDPAKAGQDAGALCGLAPTTGVLATTDKDEILALRADVVIHTASKAHAVEIFATLSLPGVTVIGQPGMHLIETAVGRVQVVGLPYITRSFLLSREEYKDQPIEEINRILVDKAEEILRQFATQIDPAFPAILTVHGSVANAILSSEQSIMMVGHDPIIPLSTLTNPAWDYVALGHIHRHQDLHQGAQPPVVYAGSIERIDFGEEREDKGFVWAQVDKGHTTYEFVPTPARRFVTLRLDTQQGDPLQLLDQALAEHDIKDAVVRVIETDLPGHEVFYIASPDTIGGHPLEATVTTYYGGEGMEFRPLEREDASAISSAKAQRLLGWQPTRSWRDYLDDEGRARA